jgi:hypothetical protein
MPELPEVEKPLIDDDSIVLFNRSIYQYFEWTDSFYADHDWETAILDKGFEHIQRKLRYQLKLQKKFIKEIGLFGIDALPTFKDQGRPPSEDRRVVSTFIADTEDFITYLEYLIRYTTRKLTKQPRIKHNKKFEYMFYLGFFDSAVWKNLKIQDRDRLLAMIIGCDEDTARHFLVEAFADGKTETKQKIETKHRMKSSEREKIQKEIEELQKGG